MPTTASDHRTLDLVSPGNGLKRRSFLQAAVASAAAGALVPSWLRDAAGAAPLGPTDGILVVVTLRGGCDALSVLVPRSGARRAAYDAARGNVAVAASSVHPITADHGLHPALGNIAQRYSAGSAAVIQGVGLPVRTRSHFDAMGQMHSSNSAQPSTGWIGRHIDGVLDSASGTPALALSQLVPLHMVGRRESTVALPLGTLLWGADRRQSFERSAYDAMSAFASTPTGLGEWGDTMAEIAASAVDKAATLGTFATAVPASSNELARALETAARAINADLGLRVVAAEVGGYDTHAGQSRALDLLLPQLDAAIERFFTVLDPGRSPQVAVLVQSEFGRTVAANASLGTEHGNAGLSLLVGENVNGGIHGESPSLTSLDGNGNLIPNIDYRAIYATILDEWLGGDANAVLGTNPGRLDLFAAGPGATPQSSPTRTKGGGRKPVS